MTNANNNIRISRTIDIIHFSGKNREITGISDADKMALADGMTVVFDCGHKHIGGHSGTTYRELRYKNGFYNAVVPDEYTIDAIEKMIAEPAETAEPAATETVADETSANETTVYAREYETGLAGIAGIMTYAANGCETELTPADLLTAVRFAQASEGELTENDYINDETGRIKCVTLDDCAEYLNR